MRLISSNSHQLALEGPRPSVANLTSDTGTFIPDPKALRASTNLYAAFSFLLLLASLCLVPAFPFPPGTA